MREVWMPVLGFDGIYEASNLGRIRRDPEAPKRGPSMPGAVIKPVDAGDGYLVVCLSDGAKANRRVNRLVLSAFCGPPPFDGAEAAHNNGDLTDNSLTNLRWATPLENSADIDRHGTRCKGEDVFGSVLTAEDVRAIRKRITNGERNPSIAHDYNVSISTIHLIRHKKTWRHIL